LTLGASAIGPVVYGLVADVWGLGIAFVAMAGSAALTVPLAPMLRRATTEGAR